MKKFAKRTEVLKESIFTTMSNKARKANAINLAQGFPDFDGPDWLVQAAKDALSKDDGAYNQYASALGAPALRKAVALQQDQDWGTAFDPESEITITVGATEAIYATLQALVDSGDEVVVFEPMYDSYAATIDMIGAIAKPVTLLEPTFEFDEKELRAAFSSKTKAIMINSPHNPTGKIFNAKELDLIGRLAVEFDAFIITDEVYEHLTFESTHQEFAQWRSSPVLRDRTVAISSAGKTFGMTGWKIGWTLAPEAITKTIRMVHQYIPFCATHPMQMAVAHGLEHRSGYIAGFKAEYKKKRDLLVGGLRDLGFDVLAPQGTYFLQIKVNENAFDFCDQLIEKNGVAAIPTAPFYLKHKQGDHLVRLCFAKRDETIREALKRLQAR
ncbi:MAG: aminotransferase [Halobacteriovorax sp.]|nr:aminotransferase [Halobacteriovorax sp.]